MKKLFEKSLCITLALLIALFSLSALNVSAVDDDYDFYDDLDDFDDLDDLDEDYLEVPAVIGTLPGCDWNSKKYENGQNSMELKDGIYSITYSDVPEGMYQFQIAYQNDWIGGGEYNDEDVVIDVWSQSDITITFNPDTKKVDFSGDYVDDYTVTSMYLGGTFPGTDWDLDEAIKMNSRGAGVYEAKLYNVPAGTYYYEFAANKTWAICWGAGEDYSALNGELVFDSSDSLALNLEKDAEEVTISINIYEYDYQTKLGAAYEVEVKEDESSDSPTDGTEPLDEEIVPGFYIVGSEEVCGEEWGYVDVWKNNEPMELSADGKTYYKVFRNVKSSDGNITDYGEDIYEFKVVYVDQMGDVTWHPGGMGNNTLVRVDEDDSTVFFQFKPLSSNPAKEGSDPEAVIATVYGPYETEPDDFYEVEYPGEQNETTDPYEPTIEKPTTAPTTKPYVSPTVKPTAAPATNPYIEPTEARKKKIDICGWKVMGIKNKTYNGKKQTQKIVVLNNEYVADISVKYYNNKDAGLATVVIQGKGKYTGTIYKSFRINKAKQPMKVKVNKITLKSSELKKKSVTIKPVTIKKAQGKLKVTKFKKGSTIMTYGRVSVNKKTGKVTVKKNNYPKGQFKVTVKIKAQGNKNYKSKTVTKTIKVNVK